MEVEDVREETEMDTLLADERDEIGSEDDDWDWKPIATRSAVRKWLSQNEASVIRNV